MKLEATRLTAALSGAWSALGMVTFDAFKTQGLQGGTTSGVLFALVMVVFFFAPFFIFVIGVQTRRFSQHMWGFIMRGLFWILGASVVAVPLIPFLSWLRSH